MKQEHPVQITGVARIDRLKVIYGEGTNLPGTLDRNHHGMVYVVSGTFKSTDGKIYFGYPEISGRIEFSKHKLSGKFTIYGKD